MMDGEGAAPLLEGEKLPRKREHAEGSSCGGVLPAVMDSMRRGGFANSTFVVMNAIMGSGLLALPYAAKSSGIVL